MNTIYKHAVELTDRQEILVPGFVRCLKVEMQNGKPCIWTEVDLKRQDEFFALWVYVVGTGHLIPESTEYLGTVFDGSFVWHIFVNQQT